MKICKCQFCGSTLKFDWDHGEIPHCLSCGAVLDSDEMYDEDDEIEYQSFIKSKLEQHRINDKIINFKHKLEWRSMFTGIVVVALAILISFGSFKTYSYCYNWYKEYNTPLEIQRPCYKISYEFSYKGNIIKCTDYKEYDYFDEDKYELVTTVTNVYECEDAKHLIVQTDTVLKEKG